MTEEDQSMVDRFAKCLKDRLCLAETLASISEMAQASTGRGDNVMTHQYGCLLRIQQKCASAISAWAPELK